MNCCLVRPGAELEIGREGSAVLHESELVVHVNADRRHALCTRRRGRCCRIMNRRGDRSAGGRAGYGDTSKRDRDIDQGEEDGQGKSFHKFSGSYPPYDAF